ncbi:MAG: YybH family protein [Candidatus Limnocylindria bacterium]
MTRGAGSKDGEALVSWLREFQSCVRAIDYERAKPLFDPEVSAFGTYEAVIRGLDRLAREQWANIWPNTSDITYRTEELSYDVAGDVAWLACPWDSTGRRTDGTTYERPGRVTVGLRRGADGRWRATHTHHSLYPSRG